MTKKQLQQYKALKKEIEELNKKILREQEKEIDTVKGRVKASMKDFPYIETHISVEMSEPERMQASIKLINEYRKRKERVEKETLEIERFISSVPDAETRLIFQYSFIDGMKQKEIAEKLHMERSSISKKITEILQLSQKSQKSVLY